MDDLPPSPARLPTRLPVDPAFVRALRDRDFAVVFAMAHDAGISFNQIAEACALKAERASPAAYCTLLRRVVKLNRSPRYSERPRSSGRPSVSRETRWISSMVPRLDVPVHGGMCRGRRCTEGVSGASAAR
ncbi:hypothetical protein GCM10020367_24360 [Streptomyces sannanensis]|uniref:DUF3263 domain-containing protein n=1 Tax=Streptomyces sannanensis TaxID=285536 RepID=A0ABP6SA81_9ACTN